MTVHITASVTVYTLNELLRIAVGYHPLRGSRYETKEQKATRQNCAPSLRRHCAADSPTQSRAYLAAPRQAAVTREDLANFLLIRGPYAWFGYGWQGCNFQFSESYNASVMNADYGEPKGRCFETAPGSE
eukprot:7381231-Prymnesium_polylepis.3